MRRSAITSWRSPCRQVGEGGDRQVISGLVKPVREERLGRRSGRAGGWGGFRQRVGAWGSWGRAAGLSERGCGSRRRSASGSFPCATSSGIEAQDYCVRLHLAADRILRRGTLKQMLRTLDPHEFVRVHRSAAVNVRHVRELTIAVDGGLSARMGNGAEVRVARGAGGVGSEVGGGGVGTASLTII